MLYNMHIPEEERRDAIEALLHSIHWHSTGEVPSALRIAAQDQQIENLKDQSCIQGARIVELENEVEHMKCLLVDARVCYARSNVIYDPRVVLLLFYDRVMLGGIYQGHAIVASWLGTPLSLDAMFPNPLLRRLAGPGLIGEASPRNHHHHHLLDDVFCGHFSLVYPTKRDDPLPFSIPVF
ncbi:hypothetical protein LIER_31110 [Lithospermum erythrorhizon]|uniref:Uncharacterized protein n=1 Tax=Lithospermum erythrorhizon TaxID=34254 RepID=A0AAV3RPW5_LITER